MKSWKISLDTRNLSTIDTCIQYYIGDASQLSKARKRDKNVRFEKEETKLLLFVNIVYVENPK